MIIKVWTDGGTRGNGTENALGAWGYWGVYDFNLAKMNFEGGGVVESTTNQRMELTAALEALKRTKILNIEAPVFLYTDSAYLYNCWKQRWYSKWMSNGWINSKEEPVSNKDLWEQLIPFFQLGFLTLKKVKGHSGNAGNEKADKIVNKQMDMFLEKQKEKVDEDSCN